MKNLGTTNTSYFHLDSRGGYSFTEMSDHIYSEMIVLKTKDELISRITGFVSDKVRPEVKQVKILLGEGVEDKPTFLWELENKIKGTLSTIGYRGGLSIENLPIDAQSVKFTPSNNIFNVIIMQKQKGRTLPYGPTKAS